MKKYFTIACAILMSFSAIGQNVVEEHFADLQEKESATVVFVAGKLFQMASNFLEATEEEEAQEIASFVETIEGFNLVMVPDLPDPTATYKAGIKKIRPDFEELIQIRDGGNNFHLMIDEDNDIVYELVGMGTSEDGEFVVFSLKGAIDLNKISKLIGDIQAKVKTESFSFRNLDINEVKVYPNPVAEGTNLTLQVEERLIGGKATIFDLNGKLLTTTQVTSTSMQIPSSELTAGYYFIEIANNDYSIKKKFIVAQ